MDKMYILQSVDNAAVDRIYNLGFHEGKEAGIKEGRSTLSVRWFFVTVLGLSSLGMVIGMVCGIFLGSNGISL